METMMGPQDPGPLRGPKAPQPLTAGQGLRTSNPKRELLSSTGWFIGTGLLGFWFGVGATLDAKMVNSLEELISVK